MERDQLDTIDTAPATGIAGQDQVRLIHQRWVVLGLLFFVTLFLGLPLLWISPRFSRAAKIGLTIVNLAYSALLLWGFYLLMAWCVSRISEALKY